MDKPPFRADHVGSLLRPAKLRRSYREYSDDALDAAGFRSAQDEAIRGVVRMQEDVGLRLVTDGEFRRRSYWSHFIESVDGLDVGESRFEFRDEAGQKTHFLAPLVVGPVTRRNSISGEDFEFLAPVTSVTPKITMPSPPTMHFWVDPGAPRAAGYASDDDYMADLAQVYREELADLHNRGASYVQIDEVPLAMLCDPGIRDRLSREGQDPDALVERYVELTNASLADRPAGLTVAMHLCRGNYRGRWLSQGGYDYLGPRMFEEAEVDAFFLEYDTDRAGGFEALSFVPEDRVVVLGLVSTKTPELEQRDVLLRRIEEASVFIPLERLALSPQCGFASTVAGNPVSAADEMDKLKLVIDVATDVWGGPGPAR